jgi:signal peptidase I
LTLATEAAADQRASAGISAAKEIPVLLLIALGIAFLVKTFVAQAFYIPSGSMIPQLKVNDRVVVSKLAYHVHSPRRADIVVFDCPPRAVCPVHARASNPVARFVRFVGERVGVVQPSTDEFIKRVIALPGETVEAHGGHVYIDGRVLVEPYLPPGVTTSDIPRQTVPPGDLWVLGDNRSNSCDSRCFGMISQKKVVGRAVAKLWPLPSMSFL